MSYEYGSESKRLELPNPYRLQNRLLWVCAALLAAAGILSLLWAQRAIEASALRLAAAPLLADARAGWRRDLWVDGEGRVLRVVVDGPAPARVLV